MYSEALIVFSCHMAKWSNKFKCSWVFKQKLVLSKTYIVMSIMWRAWNTEKTWVPDRTYLSHILDKMNITSFSHHSYLKIYHLSSFKLIFSDIRITCTLIVHSTVCSLYPDVTYFFIVFCLLTNSCLMVCPHCRKTIV